MVKWQNISTQCASTSATIRTLKEHLTCGQINPAPYIMLLARDGSTSGGIKCSAKIDHSKIIEKSQYKNLEEVHDHKKLKVPIGQDLPCLSL